MNTVSKLMLSISFFHNSLLATGDKVYHQKEDFPIVQFLTAPITSEWESDHIG